MGTNKPSLDPAVLKKKSMQYEKKNNNVLKPLKNMVVIKMDEKAKENIEHVEDPEKRFDGACQTCS